MANRLKHFLQTKLGLGQLQERLSRKQAQLNYFSTFVRLTTPESIELAPEILAPVQQGLKKERGLEGYSTAIHKNDVMFSHHIYHNADAPQKGIYGYFNVGAMLAQNLAEITRAQDVPTARVLDFGSGYGRVSRFFPAVFPQSEITVSEVKEQALQFQEEVLGMAVSRHTQDPVSFSASHYDFIIALSVFTHLPEKTFAGWLKTLLESLAPGGALLLTYNNSAALKEAGDFHYMQHSEDSNFSFIADSLSDTAEYGSTFVSDDYLRALVPQPQFELHFIKNQLIPNQETLLVKKKA